MFMKLRRYLTPPPAVEQRTVTLSGQHLTYTLKRTRRRRSIGLRIDDNGLTVNVPMGVSEKWLHSVLQDKALWVVKKLQHWQASKPLPVHWHDGQKISFVGTTLTLRVAASLFASVPQLGGRHLIVHVTDSANDEGLEQAVTQWYQREAELLFKQRVAHYVPLMKVIPRCVKLSSARTQWGSCTADGSVRLNWQLIKMPLSLVDYVVVHELAHLVEMNHSAAFWGVVEKVCPEYPKWRRELQKWSPGAGE